MATFKQIATATPNAASNTSLTSTFYFDPVYSQYAIFIPPLFAVTATCGIRILGYPAVGGDANLIATGSTYATHYVVVMDSKMASITSNILVSQWESVHSAACCGAFMMCEALKFVPGVARLQFTATTTANTSFAIYGRKED